MEIDIINRLKETEEYKACCGYNQNNPHHHLPLDLHMQETAANVMKSGKGFTENLLIAAEFHDIGKPVVEFKDKKGISRFFGHAEKSAEIAEKLLQEEGMRQSKIDIICWYIRHHDDFISFRKDAPENDPFQRQITLENVAEVILNTFVTIAGNKIKDKNATIRFLMTGEKPAWGNLLDWQILPRDEWPPIHAFRNLMVLCKADVMAQAPDKMPEKMERLNAIESLLDKAYEKAFDTIKGIVRKEEDK